MVKSKWKRMSVELHFSSYEGEAEALFNTLCICGSLATFNSEIAKANAVLWYPFEDMNWVELVDSINHTAKTASLYDEVTND